MKKLLIIFISFQSFFIIAQYDESTDVSDALQAALDIRTSVVKISKDYLYRGLKANYVSKEIDESVSKGEDALLKLEIYKNEYPRLAEKVSTIKKIWNKNKYLSIHQPQRKNMLKILKLLNNFLQESNALVEEIKKTENVNIIDYQHASNEMEILSQELALLYALKVAKIKDPMITKEIHRCKNDFQTNLDKTFYSGENTIQITEALKSLQADWEMVKHSENNVQGESFLNSMYILMNRIGDNANKASKLYQEKAKEALKKE